MYRFILLLGLSLLLWPASLLAQAPETSANETTHQPSPKLVLVETEYDAGLSPPGSSITHDFVIRNEGEVDLLINEVIPGCGCTISSFDRLISPGDEGVVKLTVELYKEWAGHRVNKAANVLSNDPTQPNLRLLMKAEVAEN